MKKIGFHIAILSALLLCLGLMGCPGTQIIQNRPLLAQVTVKAATVEFLRANPSATVKILAISEKLTEEVDSGAIATLESAAFFVRRQINYTLLLPETALAVDLIIDAAHAEAARMLAGKEVTSEETKRVVRLIAGWMHEAAEVMEKRQ